MLSIANRCTLRLCYDQTPIWNPVARVQPYMPRLDMVIGALLIIIGALALHGVIPIGGANWMIGLGSAELVLGLIMNCAVCCKTMGGVLKAGWKKSKAEEIRFHRAVWESLDFSVIEESFRQLNFSLR